MADPLDITGICFNSTTFNTFGVDGNQAVSPAAPVAGIYFFTALVTAGTFTAPAGTIMGWRIEFTQDGVTNANTHFQSNSWTQVASDPSADSDNQASLQLSWLVNLTQGGTVSVKVFDINPYGDDFDQTYFTVPAIAPTKTCFFAGYLVGLPSGGSGGSLTVTDGSTTVTNVSEINFTGATVTDGGGGTADVTISGGGGSVSILTAGTDVAAGSVVSMANDGSGNGVQTWGPAPNVDGVVTVFAPPTIFGPNMSGPSQATPGVLDMGSGVYVVFASAPLSAGKRGSIGDFPATRPITTVSGAVTVGVLNTDSTFAEICGYAKLSSAAFIYAYTSAGGVYVNVATLSGSGGSLTIAVGGSPIQIDGASDVTGLTGVIGSNPLIALTSTLAVLTYWDGTNTFAVPLGISGETITPGTPNSNGDTFASPLSAVMLSATEMMLIWAAGSIQAVYASVTASAIDVGSTAAGPDVGLFNAFSNAGVAFATWTEAVPGDPANTYAGRAVAINFSGTDAAFGSAITAGAFWSPNNKTTPFISFLSSTALAFYTGWTTPVFAELSGNTLTPTGNERPLPLVWTGYTNSIAQQDPQGLFGTVPTIFAPPMAVVDSTNIIFEDGEWSLYQCDIDANLSPKIKHEGLLFYAIYPTSPSYVLALLVDYTGATLVRMIGINPISNGPLGLTAAGASNGDPLAVVTGGECPGFTGLTPGASYFANGDGTLTLGNTGHYIGKAKTPTTMIVTGVQ